MFSQGFWIIFVKGHGVRNYELKWGGQTITAEQFGPLLQGDQSHFRKIFFVMDTCYSGSMPGSFEEKPGLYYYWYYGSLKTNTFEEYTVSSKAF